MKTVTIKELEKQYTGVYSVKADTIRGRIEKDFYSLQPGDEVLIDNHFVLIIEEEKEAEEVKTMDNINVLLDAVKEAEKAKSEAAKARRNYDEKLSDIFVNIREGFKNTGKKASEAEKENIDKLHFLQASEAEKEKYFSMLSKALSAEAIREAEVILCNNLLANKAKIEEVPARYKKVKNLLDIFDDCGIKAWYSEYYHNIEVCMTGAGLPYEKQNIYVTKNYSEPVIDFEVCAKNAEYQFRSAEEVKKAVNAFIEAKKELEEAEKQHAAHVAKIKEGRYCLGLSFSDRY